MACSQQTSYPVRLRYRTVQGADFGKASYAEVEHRLREYHSADSEEAEHFEADIVSTRISSLLQTESFVFAPPMLRQFIVIFLTAYSKMIGLDSGGRSI